MLKLQSPHSRLQYNHPSVSNLHPGVNLSALVPSGMIVHFLQHQDSHFFGEWLGMRLQTWVVVDVVIFLHDMKVPQGRVWCYITSF